MNTPIVANVIGTTEYTLKITLSEKFGEAFATWSISPAIEPDWCRLRLYKSSFPSNPDHEVYAEIDPSEGKGEQSFGKAFGAGLCMALVANGLRNNGMGKQYVVQTPVTAQDAVEGEVTFTITVKLDRRDIDGVPRPVVSWDSSAMPCRVRQSRVQFYLDSYPQEPGNGERAEWVESSTGELIIGDKRWGPGLGAAFVAEDFHGKRHYVARTKFTS